MDGCFERLAGESRTRLGRTGRQNGLTGPSLRGGPKDDRSYPTRSGSRCSGLSLSTRAMIGATPLTEATLQSAECHQASGRVLPDVMSRGVEYPRVLSKESELLPPQYSGGRGLCAANEVEFKDVLVDGSDTFRCLTLVFFGKRDQEARISRDAFAPVIPGET